MATIPDEIEVGEHGLVGGRAPDVPAPADCEFQQFWAVTRQEWAASVP